MGSSAYHSSAPPLSDPAMFSSLDGPVKASKWMCNAAAMNEDNAIKWPSFSGHCGTLWLLLSHPKEHIVLQTSMPQICISMVSSSDSSLKPPKTKILEVTDYSSRLLACHICHHDRQNDLGLKSISELSRPAIPSLDSRRKNLWGNISNITIILHEYIIYPPFIKTFQWVQQKKTSFQLSGNKQGNWTLRLLRNSAWCACPGSVPACWWPEFTHRASKSSRTGWFWWTATATPKGKARNLEHTQKAKVEPQNISFPFPIILSKLHIPPASLQRMKREKNPSIGM